MPEKIQKYSSHPLAVITGAASGLGLASAYQLAQRGFDLLLLDINKEAGQLACNDLSKRFTGSNITFVALNLSDQSEIRRFAKALDISQIDVLLNNAGLYPSFQRRSNDRDHELGMAVSFYGHFALTAQLLPRLLAAPAPRVVTVSSIAHASGRLRADDPKLAIDYDANRAYSACKLACLLFALGLDKQAKQHHSHLISVAAHPGVSRTQIGQYSDNQASSFRHYAITWATRFAMRFLGQSAEQGAAPFISAATDKSLQGGEFVGPGGLFQFKGRPRIVEPRKKTLERHDIQSIWHMAEEQTGLQFEWLKPAEALVT